MRSVRLRLLPFPLRATSRATLCATLCGALGPATLAAPPSSAPAAQVREASTEASARPPVLLSWWNDPAQPAAWTVDLRPPAPTSGDAPASPLLGQPWSERLPDLDVPLLGGGSFSLRDARGHVLIVNVWASWCGPCVKELPVLDKIYREHVDHGLRVLAINFLEAPDFAYAFASGMNLSFPLGWCTRKVEQALALESVPTAILVDRDGAVRARWSGYTEGVDERMTALAEELLAESSQPGVEVARVLRGAGRLRADWIRDASRPVEGLTFVPGGEDAEPRIAATLSRSVDLFAADGAVAERVHTPPVVGRLVADRARRVLYSFRPGARSVARVSLADAEDEVRELPTPVFDVTVVPGASGLIAAAALDGLYVGTWDEAEWRKVEGFEQVSSVVAGPGGLLALGSEGQLGVLDAQLEPESWVAWPTDAWSIVGGAESGGYGAAPFSVVATAAGRFVAEGGSRQLALALDSGDLVLLDVANGAELWRARWPAVDGLAAGDLDGDGYSELAVASGKRLVLLRRPS